VVATLAVLSLLCAGAAHALWIYPIVIGFQPFWMVVCEDGAQYGPYPGLGAAMQLGEIQCGPHGGVAEITDAGVQGALATLATCTNPSNVTVEKTLGGGGRQLLTEAQWVAEVQPFVGAPQLIPDVEVVSVVVRGVELDPTAPQTLLPIPIASIHSDEDENGSFVGGATGCPPVPSSSPISTLFMAIVLVGFGAILARRFAGRVA